MKVEPSSSTGRIGKEEEDEEEGEEEEEQLKVDGCGVELRLEVVVL